MYQTNIIYKDGASDLLVTENKIDVNRDKYDYVISSRGEVIQIISADAVLRIEPNTNRVVEKTEPKEELTYNQEDAIEYILENTKHIKTLIPTDLVRIILDLEEDYMRSIGIVDD